MAALSFPLSSLKSAAAHAMAKDAPATGNSLTDIVNRAVEFVTLYHQWSWRIDVANVILTQSVEFSVLPADFGEIISLVGNNTYKTIRVRPGQLWQMDLMKANATALAAATNGATLLYHVIHKTQASVTAVALKQLRVMPIPTLSTDTTGLLLVYAKLLPTVSADTDIVNMPVSMFGALFAVVRAFATGTEQINAPENSPNWDLAIKLLDLAKAADLRTMPPITELSNVIEDYFDAGARLRVFG